jgi:hypothetical protein
MPAAFAVANSPLTSNGTIAVTGAGTTDQYIRGDGTLASFPSLTGYVPYTGATADVDLGTHDLTAERGTFANNGSSDTLTVNHTSGSGYGIIVTKGGNNEALYVSKTSGSGNAMAVVGGRTALVDLSLSSVSNATGNFLTISGGVVHQRTASETRSDVGAQAQLNGTGFVKASGTTITYDNSTYQVTSDKAQPNGYASLDSNGKVPLTQINDALIGNVNYQGLWNASTNTPTLANPPASGTKGYYYIVSTAGTFAGISFEVGDWIISNGSAWQKVDNTDAVSSVFGRTGNVTASNGDYNTSQVTESGNLYYTDGRARGSLSFAAGSGAYNTSTGVITIPTNNNQITNGAGYITSAALGAYLPLAGGTMTGAILMGSSVAAASDSQPTALSYGLLQGFGTFTLAADTDGTTSEFAVITSGYGIANATPANGLAVGFNTLTWKNNAVWHAGNLTPVTSVTASSPLFSSGGTTPNITIQQASGSQNGFLSSTDWTTFNNKANANGSNASGTWGINITGNSTSVINTVTGTNSAELVRGNMGDNDQFRILVGASGSNAGYAEIATADDATEPIFVRQYTGVFSSLTRSATLLDGSGNTSFPGSITGNSIIKSGGTSSQYLMADGSVSTLSNPVTGTGTTNYLPKFTGTSTIGNSQIIDDGTSVSIGGISENGFLNIAGLNQNLNIYCVTSVGPNWSANLFLKGGSLTSVQALYLGYGSNYYDVYIKRNIDGRLSLGTNQNDRLSIFNQGNVFIGASATDAGYKLDVNGTARISNTTIIQNGSFSIVDNNLPQQYFRADLIPTNGRTIGTLNYGARFNSTTYGNGASIDAKAVGTWSSTNYGTNLIFSTVTENTDVNTERMRITSGGLVLIGTSTLGAATGVTDLLTIGKSGSSSTGVNFTDGTSTRWGFIYANNAKMVYGSFTDVAFESGASATERMRITSSGNVGIGTNPNQKLHIAGTTKVAPATPASNAVSTLIISNDFDNDNAIKHTSDKALSFEVTGSERMRITSGGDIQVSSANNITFSLSGQGVYLSRSGLGPRASLTTRTNTNWVDIANSSDWSGVTLVASGGNVLIGTQTTIGPAAGKVDILYSGLVQYGMNIRSTHTDGIAISFVNSSGTQVGTIYQDSSSTTYNTSSDYRLKTDLKDFNGVEIINKIKTYDFEWKTDNTRSYGVIAHELKEVIDYAVYGEKDSVTMQGVDYSKLVPIMVKAIQELKQEIETLKN